MALEMTGSHPDLTLDPNFIILRSMDGYSSLKMPWKCPLLIEFEYVIAASSSAPDSQHLYWRQRKEATLWSVPSRWHYPVLILLEIWRLMAGQDELAIWKGLWSLFPPLFSSGGGSDSSFESAAYPFGLLPGLNDVDLDAQTVSVSLAAHEVEVNPHDLMSWLHPVNSLFRKDLTSWSMSFGNSKLLKLFEDSAVRVLRLYDNIEVHFSPLFTTDRHCVIAKIRGGEENGEPFRYFFSVDGNAEFFSELSTRKKNQTLGSESKCSLSLSTFKSDTLPPKIENAGLTSDLIRLLIKPICIANRTSHKKVNHQFNPKIISTVESYHNIPSCDLKIKDRFNIPNLAEFIHYQDDSIQVAFTDGTVLSHNPLHSPPFRLLLAKQSVILPIQSLAQGIALAHPMSDYFLVLKDYLRYLSREQSHMNKPQ